MKKYKVENEFVTLKHYKEPLLSIPKNFGYGYYGCIAITLDGNKMQCHVCGKLFKDVGSHSRQAHKISVADYRETYQLARKTALISETERERRKQLSLNWIKTITPEQQRRNIKKGVETRRRNKTPQPKESLESKNKKGTCPDQLLDKIKEVKNKLGYTPSLAEFIDVTDGQRYKHLIIKVFGSWKKALKIAKLQPKKHIDNGGRRNYTNDELLEYLSIYAQENKSLPTATDCKRGLLPDYYVFIRRFGSFEKARKLAGVYNFIK